jgi:hypothetical protein
MTEMLSGPVQVATMLMRRGWPPNDNEFWIIVAVAGNARRS